MVGNCPKTMRTMDLSSKVVQQAAYKIIRLRVRWVARKKIRTVTAVQVLMEHAIRIKDRV